MYLRHKNRGSLFRKNRRCYFGGQKSPCGSAPSRTELRKCTFDVSKTQKQRFCVFKIHGVFWWGKNCGSAPSRTGLKYHLQYGISIFATRNLYLYVPGGPDVFVFPGGPDVFVFPGGPDVFVFQEDPMYLYFQEDTMYLYFQN